MKLIFMGTPALSVPHLEACLDEHEVLLVVTQPDKMARRGRHLEPAPSPVKTRALELGLPVAQPEKARDSQFVEQLRALKPEAVAVVAYGQILPQSMLDLPRENHTGGGCVNVHFSLLPRWRGAAPVQYAIWHGDRETGVTTQWMAAKLDAGDVILQRRTEIGNFETAGNLLERLTPIGADLLRETLRLMEQNRAPRMPQDEAQVTLAPTLQKEDGRIDWTQPAEHIVHQVRAFNPWPTTWCKWRGEPMKIWHAVAAAEAPTTTPPGTIVEAGPLKVATGQGEVWISDVQPAGRRRMSVMDWIAGARPAVGDKFE